MHEMHIYLHVYDTIIQLIYNIHYTTTVPHLVLFLYIHNANI
jgi:hypothetical protein